MNVVALEPRTHNVLIKKVYNTSESKKASRALAKNLKSLAQGTIIMIAVKEDAVSNVSQSLYD